MCALISRSNSIVGGEVDKHRYHFQLGPTSGASTNSIYMWLMLLPEGYVSGRHFMQCFKAYIRALFFDSYPSRQVAPLSANFAHEISRDVMINSFSQNCEEEAMCQNKIRKAKEW